jgi:hypothetical protein
MQGSQRCATETATIINLLVLALNTPSLVALSRRTPKAFATLGSCSFNNSIPSDIVDFFPMNSLFFSF